MSQTYFWTTSWFHWTIKIILGKKFNSLFAIEWKGKRKDNNMNLYYDKNFGEESVFPFAGIKVVIDHNYNIFTKFFIQHKYSGKKTSNTEMNLGHISTRMVYGNQLKLNSIRYSIK